MLFAGPVAVENDSEVMRGLEVQNETHGLFDELFERLNTSTLQENKGENEREALYAAVASVFG